MYMYVKCITVEPTTFETQDNWPLNAGACSKEVHLYTKCHFEEWSIGLLYEAGCS